MNHLHSYNLPRASEPFSVYRKLINKTIACSKKQPFFEFLKDKKFLLKLQTNLLIFHGTNSDCLTLSKKITRAANEQKKKELIVSRIFSSSTGVLIGNHSIMFYYETEIFKKEPVSQEQTTILVLKYLNAIQKFDSVFLKKGVPSLLNSEIEHITSKIQEIPDCYRKLRPNLYKKIHNRCTRILEENPSPTLRDFFKRDVLASVEKLHKEMQPATNFKNIAPLFV